MRRWVSSQSYRLAIRTIVEARKEARLTQRDLAKRLNKPPSFVAKIETGERRLDIVEFIAIALALKLQPADLAGQIANAMPDSLDF
ncbi:MAG: helix-turn-helix transcriptional regulator [Sphingobium sp.]